MRPFNLLFSGLFIFGSGCAQGLSGKWHCTAIYTNDDVWYFSDNLDNWDLSPSPCFVRAGHLKDDQACASVQMNIHDNRTATVSVTPEGGKNVSSKTHEYRASISEIAKVKGGAVGAWFGGYQDFVLELSNEVDSSEPTASWCTSPWSCEQQELWELMRSASDGDDDIIERNPELGSLQGPDEVTLTCSVRSNELGCIVAQLEDTADYSDPWSDPDEEYLYRYELFLYFVDSTTYQQMRQN